MSMRLRIEATGVDGTVLYDAVLGHGEDPQRTLASHGWEPKWVGARRENADDGEIEVVLRYAVSPGETAYPFQRLAAYAVVITQVEGIRSLLLTSFVVKDVWRGYWGLPGGGVDDGEDPIDAVHREVWEETGQTISIKKAHRVDSSHWVGRSPSGRFEDFHAVRLIYTASCSDPIVPVVHEVGGSTDEAAWVPIGQLDAKPPLQPWGREVINAVLQQKRL
ncbi:MAG: NUDIX domain-containing protein [Ornithinimicrobium sp.]